MTQIGDLSKLNILNLEGNILTGEIPTELGKLKNLREIWLYRNKLEIIDESNFRNIFQNSNNLSNGNWNN